MTAPPAKIKAYLGQVKESLLGEASVEIQHVFNGVLLVEILQRGVLPSITWRDDSPKISELIRSTAGKALLLDDASSSIPKPLLAGMSAVEGMLAEKCVKLKSQAAIDNNHGNDWKSALARCKEVDDIRLAALLQIVLHCEEDTNNDDVSNNSQLQLLRVAQGNYLRGASLQPDSPQLWKRALDAVMALHKDVPNIDAIDPLENLIRIAETKSNTKRVSELSLRLAECYLSKDVPAASASSDNAASLVTKAFLTTSTTKTTKEPTTAKAQRALSKCSDNDDVVYRILSLRIAASTEDANVEQMAKEKYESAKNRGKSATMNDCRIKARNELLIETMSSDNLEESAILLRDQVLEASFLSDNIAVPVSRQSEVLSLLSHHVCRLEDCARAVGTSSSKSLSKDALEKAWSSLSSFCLPILHAAQSHCSATGDNNMGLNGFSDDALGLLQAAFLSSVTCLWMLCGLGENDELAKGCSAVAGAILLESEQRHSNSSKQSSETAVISSSASTGNDDILVKLKCAKAAATAVVALSSDEESHPQVQQLTDEALVMAKGPYLVHQSRFGCALLQSLSAWSGLYQSAWPYCNITQARRIIRHARRAAEQATRDWGRVQTTVEAILLDLMEADAEGGILAGGFGRDSQRLLSRVQEKIEAVSDNNDLKQLFSSHCLSGLARLELDEGGSHEKAEDFARNSLEKVETMKSTSSAFYLWTFPEALQSSRLFHKSLSRQLVADALVRAGKPKDAESFLQAAVQDAPTDSIAAFALGSFRLRMVLYRGAEDEKASAAEWKLAQTQLLKAAKLDSTKAGPFALLGLWYEEKGDTARAVGCYSKALILDPAHPVAGRGILRMKSFTDVSSLCETATNTNSPLNGWAWWAVGTHKAMIDADDDLAAICFQEAIRSRDISAPHSDSLAVFFSGPSSQPNDGANDLVRVWTDLAGTYRRLGRYSAAVRAFTSAWDTSGENLPASTLCSWAQVELDLGLFDDAAEKFGLALQNDDGVSSTIAAYGQGCALLAIAQRDAQDGKAGAAYNSLTVAIDGITHSLVQQDGDSMQSEFACALKLLGDLHSFGALLPPDVFADDELDKTVDSAQLLQEQIAFVSKGESAYCSAEALQSGDTKEETDMLKAAVACDLGASILLQSQILASLHGEGKGVGSNPSLVDILALVPEVQESFERSADSFRRAIDLNPLFAPAWCGLGSALCVIDPGLSQHTLTRSIQLDKMLPDAWSNLGFLYASHDLPKASEDMMDALTQVADTPLMWICRAALLEREAFASLTKGEEGDSHPLQSRMHQAADAYRAALQVMKHPNALLGLSLSCRVASADMAGDSWYNELSGEEARKQSYGYMKEFDGLTSGANKGTSLLHHVMSVEDALKKQVNTDATRYQELIDRDLADIETTCKTLDSGANSGAPFEESKQGRIDATVIRSISADRSTTVLPNDNVAVEKAPFDHELSQAREILQDPQDGRLWLEMAKQLAKDLPTMKGVKKRKLVRQTVDAAVLSANRAALVLSQQVSVPKSVHPSLITPDTDASKRASTHGPVRCVSNASEVSEALALSYWVGCATKELVDEKDEKDAAVLTNTCSPYDLQKSLFMCPNNALAREALKTNNGTD